MLVTDIKTIKKRCQENKEENWEFRRFLKSCELGVKEIDEIVLQVYQEVLARIDCTNCANCCKEANFLIEEKDVKRLAKGLNLSLEEFKENYVEECEEIGEEGYGFKRLPCPFLQDNKCTVYSFRPDNCRSFPYVHNGEFVFKLINVIENCEICPIVFNVYERLKEEIDLHIREDAIYFEDAYH